MALSHMLYVSRSRLDWTPEELDRLAEVSRRRNAPDGLTGLLLYGRGHFLQLLKGRRQPLVLTFDRIVHDARHTDIDLLLDGPIAQRLFDGWAMGLLNVDQAGDLARDRFDRIVASLPRGSGPVLANAVALELLREFKAQASATVPGRLPDLS